MPDRQQAAYDLGVSENAEGGRFAEFSVPSQKIYCRRVGHVRKSGVSGCEKVK
jgi:hypothetical protein